MFLREEVEGNSIWIHHWTDAVGRVGARIEDRLGAVS